MHEVLVNRLGGLSLPRKSVVRLSDRPNKTLDVYRGRKTTTNDLEIYLHETRNATISSIYYCLPMMRLYSLKVSKGFKRHYSFCYYYYSFFPCKLSSGINYQLILSWIQILTLLILESVRSITHSLKVHTVFIMLLNFPY